MYTTSRRLLLHWRIDTFTSHSHWGGLTHLVELGHLRRCPISVDVERVAQHAKLLTTTGKAQSIAIPVGRRGNSRARGGEKAAHPLGVGEGAECDNAVQTSRLHIC